ncbi:MAG: aldo/keto reductase, partial [Pseudomonadota bacterium]|nr:aldo/keto reductase [Pseudomonadota bacterium]
MVSSELNRRDFIRLTAAGVATACLPKLAFTLEPVIKRAIPETGEMLQIMLEADANVVDASPMYGRAEGVMGELLAETDTRNATFLANKVWTEGTDRGIAQMAESRRRFRTDRIDLMQ